MNEGQVKVMNILEDNGINTEWLEEEGTVFLEHPDYYTAVVGVTTDGSLVYDYNKMVEHSVEYDGYSYEDALDDLEYNTIRAIPYMPDPKPIIMYPVEQEFDEKGLKIYNAMIEISRQCEVCPLVSNCKEDECALFRIEKCLL